MKRSVRLSSLALLLAAPAVVLSCSSSETSDEDEPEGGSGGDNGGSDGGKGGSGGAGKGGSGGSGSGTAGKGGTTANGGSGGTTSGGANGTAGSGGSGGSGNTAGTGGGDMGGSGTGGTAPVDFCALERDRCYPGPAGPAKRTSPKANQPAVCALDRAMMKDGDLGQGPMSVNEPLTGLDNAGGKYQDLSGAGDKELFKQIYVPKAMDTAANGGLGILFVLGGDGTRGLKSRNDYTGYSNRKFTLEGLTDKLAQNGDIPPLLVVWPAEHGSTVECRDTRQAIDNWRMFMLPRLKQLFPKLSDKSEMRAIIGQSTEGAKAFDFAWRAPDLVSKVFSGSGSFVCFMRLGMTAFQDTTKLIMCPKMPTSADEPTLCCPVTTKDQTPLPGCDNFGYGRLIRSCAAKSLRVSLSVGRDDITPQGVPGQDDTSSCQANWLQTNTDVAAALKEKGVDYQFMITPGGHGPDSWVAYAGDRFRWLFRDVMCFD